MECPYCVGERPIMVSVWEGSPIVTGVSLIRDRLIMSVSINNVQAQTACNINFCPVCGKNLKEEP